jgi:hypothetical protein
VQQIERGNVCPLHIVDEEHQRSFVSQYLTKADEGLEHPGPSRGLVARREREVGVAVMELWENAAELSEPDRAEPRLETSFLIQPGPQGID